jgi:hypothetical protein
VSEVKFDGHRLHKDRSPRHTSARMGRRLHQPILLHRAAAARATLKFALGRRRRGQAARALDRAGHSPPLRVSTWGLTAEIVSHTRWRGACLFGTGINIELARCACDPPTPAPGWLRKGAYSHTRRPFHFWRLGGHTNEPARRRSPPQWALRVLQI